jgi:hypothetical protein
MFPEAAGAMEKLLKPDVVRGYPSQAFRDDMTNTGVSPNPHKSDAKETNGNTSCYSDGT